MLNYRVEQDVAIIGLDDGKANAVGHSFVDALNQAKELAQLPTEVHAANKLALREDYIDKIRQSLVR